MLRTRTDRKVNYRNTYIRNSRAIGVLWGLFTACFAILNIVVFLQPQWIGDTLQSPTAGHFGLYEYCLVSYNDINYESNCKGTWSNFKTILNPPFAAATFFVGLSSRIVYIICGCLQLLCTICLIIGVIIYPSGFDNEIVRSVCGQEAKDYNAGLCQIRWAYIVAIISIFDVLLLSILAFTLALKQPKNVIVTNDADTKYGQLNGGFGVDDQPPLEQQRYISFITVQMHIFQKLRASFRRKHHSDSKTLLTDELLQVSSSNVSDKIEQLLFNNDELNKTKENSTCEIIRQIYHYRMNEFDKLTLDKEHPKRLEFEQCILKSLVTNMKNDQVINDQKTNPFQRNMRLYKSMPIAKETMKHKLGLKSY
ncbi:unnamed protein product [Didymodactylos carnosus]|uniref:Uncharacterized protein n=1 Tax=Didymodactylos carnosus TaxID=1234261 RepID=A0A815N1E6_9BILA|nr:unnamed protein product [Didymodactylos carnosus]CAF1430477.1 unnamed protein product [Didymodactylos carnosus]CAF4145469.1 unnamed protein product [Didymodactylos carnosus]CAF4309325.1 unnamed protein product [Didymodactylos carnosus]